MYNKDVEQLLKATEAGDAVKVQEILSRTKNIINLSNENGETAIYIAAKKGKLNVAQVLIDAGANIKLQANNGKSPLDVSSNSQVTMLLAKVMNSGGGYQPSISSKMIPMEISPDGDIVKPAGDKDKFDTNQQLTKAAPSSSKLDSAKSFFSSPATGSDRKVPNMARRNSISTKTKPNFGFSEALEKAENEVQVEQDTLEDIRIKVKKFLAHSPYGVAFENVIMAVNILSTLEVIYSTYLIPVNQWDNSNQFVLRRLDLGFGAIFALVWTLGFLTADRKIPYIFSLSSMVDITTVIPIFATYNYDEKPLYKMGTFEDVVFYVMFLLKNTRILRSLQLTHKLIGIKDAVDRYIGEIAINISVMILFFSGVMQFLEKTQQPLPYHTWMYYIWVTIATVGYGDITPKTDTGRFAAMAMIGFAIISVPKMTNTLIEKMNLQSVYARAVYTAKSRSSRHIIICGDLTSTSLEDFFEELFHEDHENDDLNAVLLIPSPPSVEILLMLRDPKYSLSVSCLQGSALVDADLKRCSAETSVAIFIMTNKFSTNPDEEDAKSILQNLSIKRYLSYTPHLRSDPLFCMQLIRPENLRQLSNGTNAAAGANANNANPDDSNVVVCLNEIKMGVLARAVVYPGANTFIMNLITSFSDDAFGPDDTPDENETAIKEAAGKAPTATTNSWLKEYQKGCDWEIYTTSLSDIFIGAKFSDLSLALYMKLGVVLFALQLTELRKKKCKSKLLLNPADFVIPPKEEYKVEAFVIAKNKASSDLSFSGKGQHDNAFQAVAGGIVTLGNVIKSTVTNTDAENRRKTLIGTNLMNTETQVKLIDKESPSAKKEGTSSKKVSKWNVLKRSSLLDKKVQSSGYQETLQRLEDEHFQKAYYVRPQPAELNDVIIKTSLLEEIPFINNHIIVIGKELSNLYDLVKPLRAKYLGNIKYIIILYPHDVPFDVWQRICMFDCIHIVRGSPLEEMNLRRAGIFRAQQVVVLAEGSTNTPGSGNEALVDSDAIFAYQCVKRMNPSTQVVIEIVNQSNIGYLVTDMNATANTSDYKFSNQFAAGTLFTTSLLDSLICQAYYNPHIIKVVNKLISGVDQQERIGLPERAMKEMLEMQGEKAQNSDDDEDDVFVYDNAGNKIPKLSEIKGACLYQISMPDHYVKKTYGNLYQHLALQGIIPLGLLRGVLTNLNIGPKSNKMPYVYTNPEMGTELYQCDRIFVLSVTPLQTQGKTSVKDWLLDIQMQKSQSLAAAAAANNNGKPIPGTIPAGIETLQNSQKKLEDKFNKLSGDMNRKFNSIVTLLKHVVTNLPGSEDIDVDDLIEESIPVGTLKKSDSGKDSQYGSGKEFTTKEKRRKFSVDSQKSQSTVLTATSDPQSDTELQATSRSEIEEVSPQAPVEEPKELTFREKIKLQAKKNREEAMKNESKKLIEVTQTSPSMVPVNHRSSPPASILRKHSVDMGPPTGSPTMNTTDAGFTPAVTGKKRYSFSEPVVSTVAVIKANDDSDHTEEKESASDVEGLGSPIKDAPKEESVSEKISRHFGEFKPTELHDIDSDDGHEADKEEDNKHNNNKKASKGSMGKYVKVDESESESEGVKVFAVKTKPEAKVYEPKVVEQPVPRRPNTAGAVVTNGSVSSGSYSKDNLSPQPSVRDDRAQRPVTAHPSVGVLSGPPLAAIMRNSPRRPPQKTYIGLNTDSETEM